MEDPLIGRETHGGGTDRIVRRSEAITHGTAFQKAAALVDLQPLWCEKNPTPSCQDRDYYYLGELPYLTNAESIIFEVFTLAIVLVHTFFPMKDPESFGQVA